MTKEDFLIKNLGTIAKSRTSGILSAGLSCFPIAMLSSLLHYIGLKVTGYWMICSFIQLLWRKCRQLEILISSGSLELGSAQSILLLTMLKLSANKMKISSMPLFAYAVLSIRDFTKRNCDYLPMLRIQVCLGIEDWWDICSFWGYMEWTTWAWNRNQVASQRRS